MNISGLIGMTPTLPVTGLYNAEIAVKLEFLNALSNSIKERIAYSMIEAGIRDGSVTDSTIVVEPTSGNTGIGLAAQCAARGLKCILVMPISMPEERRKAMSVRGAEIVLVDGNMALARKRAEEIVDGEPRAWMPNQFENPANPLIHYQTTGPEIFASVYPNWGRSVTHFVTGVGTGGHITGVGSYLKEWWPHIKIIAVEPEESPVLSGGQPGKHGIYGIGAGFVPGVLNKDLIDDVYKVSTEEAKHESLRFARNTGLWVGISSGASLAAVSRLPTGSRAITVAYDLGLNNLGKI